MVKSCKVEGCPKSKRLRGFCFAHGRRFQKRCRVHRCDSFARKLGLCRLHGSPGIQCKINGCPKQVQNNGLCYSHGAKRTECSVEGCESHVQSKGVCFNHGAPKAKCKVKACGNLAKQRGVCCRHGATRAKCKIQDCRKSVASGGLCVGHGAPVKRCKVNQCTNFARKSELCRKHGSQDFKLCKVKECTNKAKSGNTCHTHGAKDRRKLCCVQDCDNYARSLSLCATHGAPYRICSITECSNISLKGGCCSVHGGGRRCRNTDVHHLEDFPPHVYASFGECLACLEVKHPERVKWRVRKEQFVLAEIQALIPELWTYFVSWDCPVSGGCSMHRPDMLWDMFLNWFSIEIDENGHDQAEGKYQWVTKSMGNRPGVLLRINPDYKDQKMFVKMKNSLPNSPFKFKKSNNFDDSMCQIESIIRCILPFLTGEETNLPTRELKRLGIQKEYKGNYYELKFHFDER